MNLNNPDKNELRRKIEGQVREIRSEGKILRYEKDLLESLLFQEIVINEQNGIRVKLPIWSGEFLQKIDLSEVDFTNVSWSILGKDDISMTGVSIDEHAYDMISKIKERLKYENGFAVGYGYTNAHIDLTKSFEAIHEGVIDIWECDFSGVDFSKQNLTKVNGLNLYCSSIANTNLSIPKDMCLIAVSSNFSNIDLSSHKINVDYSIDVVGKNLYDCCLVNTGIQIDFDAKLYKQTIDDYSIKTEVLNGEESNVYVDYIKKALNEQWVGCYVNGKIIESIDEKKLKAKKKLAEYEKMKDKLLYTVVIGEQSHKK